MKYPEYVRINGQKVKIKTDFKTAIKALNVSQDPMIGDIERTMAVVYIMYGFIPDFSEIEEYMKQACKFLQCGKPLNNTGDEKRDMDLIEDEEYINASFMSDYHIDLSKTEMHFWQFCNLITGFTDKSIMSRVREIRNIDPADVPEKQRSDILKAKEALELTFNCSREEIEAMERFESFFE